MDNVVYLGFTSLHFVITALICQAAPKQEMSHAGSWQSVASVWNLITPSWASAQDWNYLCLTLAEHGSVRIPRCRYPVTDVCR